MATKGNSIRTSIGPTILLGSGNFFDYDDPENSRVTLSDFAYSLAFTTRFSGQCVSRRTGKRVFYSVAQHCEIMSRLVPGSQAYAALMHESGETVCGDLNTPLKSKLSDYRQIEKRCSNAIMTAFGVVDVDHVLIKAYDVRLWATERRDLMNWDGRRWAEDDDAQPFDLEIVPLGPYDAAESFLARFNQIAPRRIRDRESTQTSATRL
ncbi:hypothetical protein FJ937_04645 [Mesorhizobium sp. B2-4-4]|uniref:hypothetical protein n=1 Tax=Mesorhizobium sp. B2-4-4 TaxID=2589945 RepID=UPI00112C6F98|nr:hypothetical protein [Mesorhizobium sp. B2-4-4]TPL54933.1 hypothetical protein FJ937_04645 [Mesorhizobium sp. B2-4-4]